MSESLAMSVYSRAPVWLQNVLCSMEGQRLIRLRFGGGFARWAAFYADSRSWSYGELHEYQREQLKELIRHCFDTVPYYSAAWRDAGLRPDDYSDVGDLVKLPCTTKEGLFTAGERIISTSFPRHRVIRNVTGGSTGMPLPIYYDVEEIRQHFALFWDRMRPGVRRGDRYATFQGKDIVPAAQVRPPYWRENYAANQRLYSMRHLSPDKLADYAEDLIAEPFVYYQGYASFLSVVAGYMAERGLSPRIPPKAVFTTSEQLTVPMRRLFENTWRTRVWDEYCQGEHCALLQECEHGNHHVQLDYCVIEFEPVERRDGGMLAEMICTGLIPRAAPMIRYRVGDKVLIKEDAECPCGRPGPVITAIVGRTSEYIRTPDGGKYPHISLIVGKLRNVRATQVVQERPEEITVRIVPFSGYTQDDERHVIRCFKERIGGGLKIAVERVAQLERLPNGKVLSIINRIPGADCVVGDLAGSARNRAEGESAP